MERVFFRDYDEEGGGGGFLNGEIKNKKI